MRRKEFWPLPVVILGTLIAVFGTLGPSCKCLAGHACNGCPTSPNYILNIAGLILTVVFTYVFVFLSTHFNETGRILNSPTA